MSFVLLVLLGVSSTEGFAPVQIIAGRPAAAPQIIIPRSSTTQCQMFTGIVEEMGEVVKLEERDDMTLWDGSKGAGTELTVKGGIVMEGAYLGYVPLFCECLNF